MEWKKIAGIEYGKIVFHSIPYHALVFPMMMIEDENDKTLLCIKE